MITNKDKLNEFERELIRKENLSHKGALPIYEALYKEAIALGAISHENIWDGFEVDLRIAQAMSRLKRARETDKKSSRKVRRR
jgi:hypothetical protein